MKFASVKLLIFSLMNLFHFSSHICMQDPTYGLQMHSSFIQRLSQEKELEVCMDLSFVLFVVVYVGLGIGSVIRVGLLFVYILSIFSMKVVRE